MSRISAVVLTRNEERHIEACLKTLRWADELLIVDSGSTDQTVEIATRAGARVVHHPFTSYADQRNAALDLATGDWVFFLDADERASKAVAAAVREASEREDLTGAYVPRRNLILKHRMRGGGWWPDAQLRLLRRGKARYDTKQGVHEVALLDGPSVTLSTPILHHNYERLGQLFSKQDRYASQYALDLAAHGVRPLPHRFVLQPLRQFWRRFVTWHGYRDGMMGFGLALLLAYYELVSYIRLARLVPSPPTPTPDPAPADAVDAAGNLDLGIVIVNWNVRDLLAACLESLLNREPGDRPRSIVVVDNGSSDGSVEMLRDRFPEVTVLERPDNPGFAAANNAGAALLDTNLILLLNPDTVVRPGALAKMAQALAANPAAGSAGPTLLYGDENVSPSRRRFPTLLTLFLESTPIEQWTGGLNVARHYRLEGEATGVQWVEGACMLVRRSVWEATGGMDSGFFMYFEETDWFRRAARIGWGVVFVPDAVVIHYTGKSSEQNVASRHMRFNGSKVRYARKHFGNATALVLGVWLRLLFAVQAAEEGGKWLLGHKRPLRRQRLGQLSRVLRSSWPA